MGPIRSYLPQEDYSEAMNEWLEIDGLTGQVGGMRDVVAERRNRLFGKGFWALGWRFEGRIIDRGEALYLYEESYFQHLRDHADVLDWITATACEVYDNAVTNVESGTDYAVQETNATHLQDISIRRSIIRLGRSFEGDHLVQVRGHETEGFRLNPGQVPFHRPEEIAPREKESWWKPTSVEAFWQHNKVLIVHPDALKLRPIFLGVEGVWCELDERMALLVPFEKPRVLSARPIRILRSQWNVRPKLRKHQQILNAPQLGYRELTSLTLSAGESVHKARILWSDLTRGCG